jgi:hypothetical protein
MRDSHTPQRTDQLRRAEFEFGFARRRRTSPMKELEEVLVVKPKDLQLRRALSRLNCQLSRG